MYYVFITLFFCFFVFCCFFGCFFLLFFSFLYVIPKTGGKNYEHWNIGNGNFHAGVNFGRGRGLRNLWPYHMLVPRARHNIMLRAHVYCARRKEGRGKHISGVFEQVFVCAA